MSEKREIEVTTVVMDEQITLTLAQLCHACDVSAEAVIAMVEEGLIRPTQEGPWRFPATELRRVRTVVHLQRDLDVNLPGAALAVELLEELQELRARVDRLERLFEQ